MRGRWLLGLSIALACTGAKDEDQGDDDEDDDIVGDDDDIVGDDDDDDSTGCESGEGVDVVDHTVEPIEGLQGAAIVEVTLAADAEAWLACTLTDAPATWRQLLPLGSTWTYLDDAAAPVGWEASAFDDGSWASGPGPFGFAEEVRTEIGTSGPPDVAYFRAEFDVVDPAAVTDLRFDVRRDDGLAVYLNGTEVVRDNLPAGPLDATTEALLGITGSEDELGPHTFSIDPAGLVAGTNTIAVRLHQFAGSSDAGFDLRVDASVHEPLTDETHLVESTEVAGAHTLRLLGLLADATYSCTARSGCGAVPAEFDVQTLPFVVPPPLLAAPVGGPDPSWGTYTLFNHIQGCGGDDTHRLIMVDPDGRVRWTYLLEGLRGTLTMDVESKWLGDGEILWGGGDDVDGVPEIVRLDHSVAHLTAYPGADTKQYHHDVEMVGTEILGLVSSAVTPDGVQYWAGFSLIQHDPATQQITWEWNAQTAYDAGQLPVDGSGDPYHPNSLASVDDVDGAGVYVTLLTTDQVIRVDRATGDVTWKLGRGGDFALVDAAGAPLPDTEWMDGMHAIDVFDDRVVIYENGYGDAKSEVLVFTLDIPGRVATLEYSWSEFRWYEPVWGDADELSNGDMLVAMGHSWCIGGNDDHLGALVDVDIISGQAGWRLDFLDPNDALYRAERIDGCELFGNSRFCPDVAARLLELTSR